MALTLREELKTVWTLPFSTIDKELSNHFIQYWDAHYFKHKLDKAAMCIEKEGRLFNVYLHRCTLEELLKCDGQVALSFRVAHHKYNINPIVLVSCNKGALNQASHKRHNHWESKYSSQRNGKLSEVPHTKVIKKHTI